MATKAYKEYLQSAEWKELKLDLIQLRGANCEKCKRQFAPNKLQPHHKTYDNIFKETGADLILLCPRCHMKEHKDKIPAHVLKKFGLKKDKPKPAKKVKKKKAPTNGKKAKVAGWLAKYKSGSMSEKTFSKLYRATYK